MATRDSIELREDENFEDRRLKDDSTWLERQYSFTPVILGLIFAAVLDPTAYVTYGCIALGVIGMLFCREREARRNAVFLAAIAAVRIGASMLMARMTDMQW